MDFCKSCEELHAVSRIPLTIVHQEGEVRLALPAGHEDLIPHRALTWVLADFVLQKRDALHPLVTLRREAVPQIQAGRRQDPEIHPD